VYRLGVQVHDCMRRDRSVMPVAHLAELIAQARAARSCEATWRATPICPAPAIPRPRSAVR
jgi:hypothetical protein